MSSVEKRHSTFVFGEVLVVLSSVVHEEVLNRQVSLNRDDNY